MHDYQTLYSSVNRHPISWVRDVLNYHMHLRLISQNVSLAFSKYKYIQQTFEDKRNGFILPFHQLNETTLFNIISALTENEELAFHSHIQDFGKTYHLPLIDFGNVDRGIIDSGPLRELSSHWDISFKIYSSGRSFHAYGNKLIGSDDWVKFMGSLLLLNRPSGFKLIDERWVGHRIMAGYSALRWSNNSSHYKKTPTCVAFLNSDGLIWGDKGHSLQPIPRRS